MFDALDIAFDLDVAAPIGGVPWIPAARHYCATVDGLAQPWTGSVWCNPPFSNAGPWARRFVEHGNGVVLFPINVNASWMYQLVRAVPSIAMLEHLRFVHPTHTGRYVPVTVALAGLGARHVAAVERAAARLSAVLLRVC